MTHRSSRGEKVLKGFFEFESSNSRERTCMNKSPNIPDDGCSCSKSLGNNVANPTVIVDVMIIGLRTVSEREPLTQP